MADQSLLIPKYIQQILEENNEVKAILGENEYKIFPLQQPAELSFPYIVHSRNAVTVRYTKDIIVGWGWDNEVQYTVKCVSDDYVQGIELANAVRHALEANRYKDENITIHPIELLTATEYLVDDNVFVQELVFKCFVE